MASFVPFFANANAEVSAKLSDQRPDSLTNHFFDQKTLKTLFLHSLRPDLPDNNQKASIITKILPPPDFIELGTGTNRITLMHNGFAIKIALDRRGYQDNYVEFKRSQELPHLLAKTYETNLMINISECVDIMTKPDFLNQEANIKTILAGLAESYLFNDIGFIAKNFCNWGYRIPEGEDIAVKRTNQFGDGVPRDLIILDYGYMYPLLGQSRDLFRCPTCGAKIEWNPSFTKFRCENAQCRLEYTPVEIFRRMDMTIMEKEDEILQRINGLDGIDFRKLEQAIAKLYVD